MQESRRKLRKLARQKPPRSKLGLEPKPKPRAPTPATRNPFEIHRRAIEAKLAQLKLDADQRRKARSR
jgi:hypothetical protein